MQKHIIFAKCIAHICVCICNLASVLMYTTFVYVSACVCTRDFDCNVMSCHVMQCDVMRLLM